MGDRPKLSDTVNKLSSPVKIAESGVNYFNRQTLVKKINILNAVVIFVFGIALNHGAYLGTKELLKKGITSENIEQKLQSIGPYSEKVLNYYITLPGRYIAYTLHVDK
jgi:hypothetical protein